MKKYMTILLALCCLCLAVPGQGVATEAKVAKKGGASSLSGKKIGKLKIEVPYDEKIDMSVASHAEDIGGKFSTILENQYINELEHKKEADRNFRQ